jgi:hypothetical protein
MTAGDLKYQPFHGDCASDYSGPAAFRKVPPEPWTQSSFGVLLPSGLWLPIQHEYLNPMIDQFLRNKVYSSFPHSRFESYPNYRVIFDIVLYFHCIRSVIFSIFWEVY